MEMSQQMIKSNNKNNKKKHCNVNHFLNSIQDNHDYNMALD